MLVQLLWAGTNVGTREPHGIEAETDVGSEMARWAGCVADGEFVHIFDISPSAAEIVVSCEQGFMVRGSKRA